MFRFELLIGFRTEKLRKILRRKPLWFFVRFIMHTALRFIVSFSLRCWWRILKFSWLHRIDFAKAYILLPKYIRFQKEVPTSIQFHSILFVQFPIWRWNLFPLCILLNICTNARAGTQQLICQNRFFGICLNTTAKQILSALQIALFYPSKCFQTLFITINWL